MQQLLLTNPCTENWDDMLPSKKGRYCESCSKHIVDLTTKSDAELIAFFKNKKGDVCGRLLSSQLHRELILPPQKGTWQWLIPVALGASAIPSVQAQEIKPEIVQQYNGHSQKPGFEQHYKEVKRTDTIKGRVIDQLTGTPLAGVKVSRKGFKNTIAISNDMGYFSINLIDAERINPLVFILSDYNILEQNVSNNMVVKLTKEQIVRMMVGAVASINTSTEPLYVVSVGKKSCTLKEGAFKNIDPNWIENIKILKDASATAIYGLRGANGVILIDIKNEYKHKIDFSNEKIKTN